MSKPGEFELIAQIREMFATPEGFTGIGDDCAVLPQKEGLETLVSTDLLVEGVHFLKEKSSPFDLGWKAAAVNFSDIAAMGGEAQASFLSMALPEEIDTPWLREFIRGYKSISDLYGFALLGGDTTSSGVGICINVCVTGTCPAGKALRRDKARAGDMICVTGPLGDSAAGLSLILSGEESLSPLLAGLHRRPVPRMREGLELRNCAGVHSMMDISDGLGSDLRHILEESKVGACVDTGLVPISDETRRICLLKGLDPLDFALSGGEDYELLFTCAPGTTLPAGSTVIGTITEQRNLVWQGSDKDYRGFRHF